MEFEQLILSLNKKRIKQEEKNYIFSNRCYNSTREKYEEMCLTNSFHNLHYFKIFCLGLGANDILKY